MFAFASEEEWARFLPTPLPYERQHAEEFIARQRLKDWSLAACWALVFEGAVVGGVDLKRDPPRRSAALGYSLARRCWGRGLMSEAVKAVVDAGFGADPGLNRVEAWADVRNVASRRVMEKVGMTFEGVLRQRGVIRGELVDDAWYSVLRSEWQS